MIRCEISLIEFHGREVVEYLVETGLDEVVERFDVV